MVRKEYTKEDFQEFLDDCNAYGATIVEETNMYIINKLDSEFIFVYNENTELWHLV